MVTTLLIPETDLENMVIQQVKSTKATFPDWRDPEHLAGKLGIRVVRGNLGLSVQGVAVDDLIVLDEEPSVPGRRMFTFYHEIVHQLIRRNDELVSIIHDQYESDQDYTRIAERLANIGASEFLIPRSEVLAATHDRGFTLELLQHFKGPPAVSFTAVCVQLALCAPHQCAAVVCRRVVVPRATGQLTLLSDDPQISLAVEVGVTSRKLRYRLAKGTPIRAGHLLYTRTAAPEWDFIRGKGPIPFRNQLTNRLVDCEAVRIGTQVFGLFHVDAAPHPMRGQLQFEF